MLFRISRTSVGSIRIAQNDKIIVAGMVDGYSRNIHLSLAWQREQGAIVVITLRVF